MQGVVGPAEADWDEYLRKGIELLEQALGDLGLRPAVASELMERYPLAYLWRKIAQTRFARRRGLAKHPAGWLVASLERQWHAPDGCRETDELSDRETAELLSLSWGVCLRCRSRPCRCSTKKHAADEPAR